jgi:hypothetical protein
MKLTPEQLAQLRMGNQFELLAKDLKQGKQIDARRLNKAEAAIARFRARKRQA